ncbi:MAG: hypothetical protein AAFO95_13445 [Cyanobacteria bacterium J06600_6]
MIKIAAEKITNWVYVTGVPRSGTTFVGKILSIPLKVDYIHEPFNPQCGMIGMERWYPYIRPTIDTDEMKCFHELTKKIFSYDLNFKKYVPRNDPWHRQAIKRAVGSRGEFYLRLAKPNPFHTAAIIKDPIGNLLTEYLHHNFQVKPVIVIKHPLSFIASLKRVNWWIQTSWITENQPYLVEDYFNQELNFVNRKYATLLEGSAAYWRATYKVLLEQAEKHPEWQVITLEELSQEPVESFHRLYNNLGLPWSDRVSNKIKKLTVGNRSAQAKSGLVQDFKRNSADIFKQSLKSIDLEERRAIFEIVKDVALKIYPESSFALESEKLNSY